MFLTFKGRDLHDRTCLSENYDLIGFSDFNEISMFQSLLKMSQNTYDAFNQYIENLVPGAVQEMGENT